MVQHCSSFQNPKGIISHFFLGRVTFQTGLLGISRLDSVAFLSQEEGQWEETHANPFFTALSEKPGINEDPGVSPPVGTLLDTPLQGAHSPPTTLGGEEYSAYSSHHKVGTPWRVACIAWAPSASNSFTNWDK